MKQRWEVKLLEQDRQTLYGIAGMSSDTAQRRDIPAFSAKLYQSLDCKKGTYLPFYVVSHGYDEKNGTFMLFVGGKIQRPKLEQLVLPAGTYASITVHPKLGFLWGLAIGAAKYWFYTVWLPSQPYEPVNLEYELHTESSSGTHAAIDLLFAIRETSERRERT
ncbi:MAG: GyrI-like domain-containing protein [Butyricicoccus sp.]